MVIDKQTREEWRKLAGQGMHSALGEYTPVDEFVALLDYIDELEAQLTQRAGGLPITSADIVESIKDDDEREDSNPLFYGSR